VGIIETVGGKGAPFCRLIRVTVTANNALSESVPVEVDPADTQGHSFGAIQGFGFGFGFWFSLKVLHEGLDMSAEHAVTHYVEIVISVAAPRAVAPITVFATFPSIWELTEVQEVSDVH
jgi:hypothetical protein